MKNIMPRLFEPLDAPDAWAPKNTCHTLELASRYLFDEVQRIESGCPLSEKGRRLRNAIVYVQRNYIEKDIPVPADKKEKIMSALNVQGNLGYALWRLHPYRSAGYDFELKQLAQVGDGSDASKQLLRSHGFLFLIAARLAEHLFDIEFCLPGEEEGPDLIV